MARSLKTSPFWQLALVFTFYIIFFILFAFIYMLILRYYHLDTLRHTTAADPGVMIIWKAVTILDPVFSNLIPAFLFTWIITSRPITWLHLDRFARWQPALFVTVIVLLAVPVAGVLYDWNCTFGFAKSSVLEDEEMAATAHAVDSMPHIGYLFMNLAFFVLVPAIARECFFRGVLQQVLINMSPRAPWLGIGVTAILFGLSFFQWQYVFSVTFWGILLGTIYYLTESLWLSILGHFIYRSVGMIQSFFYQRHWTNDDPYHPSRTPWYLALICLAGIAGLVWYSRKSIPRPVAKVSYQDDIDSIGRT